MTISGRTTLKTMLFGIGADRRRQARRRLAQKGLDEPFQERVQGSARRQDRRLHSGGDELRSRPRAGSPA